MVEFTFSLQNIDLSSGWQCDKLLRFKIKRIIDIVGAVLGILLLLPVMLIIAIIIKSTSKGPILFCQDRVGLHGQIFKFYKFRSMVHNNNDLIHKQYVSKLINKELPDSGTNGNNHCSYKLKNDPRITPFGKFLRSWSLDELPQFFNILKGDMSLVGPRPATLYEVKNYNAWHLQRLEIFPGLSGLWQVEGRSKMPFDEMVRLDIRYVRNWSLWLDFKILFRTFKAVMSREGAL